MYDGKHYYKVGLSAIRCINEALKLAGLTKVGSILDLPCGSGRVLRFLVHQFPEAEITGCELEPGPVRILLPDVWCASCLFITEPERGVAREEV